MDSSASRIGFWAAIFSGIFGTAFSVAALVTMAGLLSKPWDLVYQLAPSLVLAWCFVVLMACVWETAPAERRVWATIGMGFSLIYATINSIVYPTQLFVVIPNLFKGTTDQVTLLLFESGGFLYAINGIAYGLMSLATLFAAQAFRGRPRAGLVYWAMVAHGVLAPFISAGIVWPWTVYIGALWMVTLPLVAVALALWFRRQYTAAG